MKKVPKILVNSASVKSAEVSGAVTVGAETAALLTKKLGREVKPGEVFELGTLAYYHQSPWKRLWGSFKILARPHLFTKPLNKGN